MTASRLDGDLRRTGRRERSSQHRCLGCDTHVSAEFARVFGNNEDTIYACLNCTTLAALRDGQAGEPH